METIYYPSGKIYSKKTPTSHCYYYESGQCKTSISLQNGKIEGEVVLYWPDGTQKRRSLFQGGKVVEEEFFPHGG